MAISADMMSWNFTLQTAKRKVFFSEPDPGFLAADKEILGKSNGKLQITLKKKWFSCKYIFMMGDGLRQYIKLRIRAVVFIITDY